MCSDLNSRWARVEMQAHKEFKVVYRKGWALLNSLQVLIRHAGAFSALNAFLRLIDYRKNELRHALDEEERHFLMEFR
jgi:hypothetical protein